MAAPTVSNLPDLLFGHGIRPKHWGPGHSEQIICPRCSGGTHREVSLTVTIDQDNEGAVWKCHRGSCGWTDGAKLIRDHATPRHQPERVIRTPAPHTCAGKLPPIWFDKFFEERRIGDRTLKAFGVYALEDEWFPPPLGKSNSIVFPYIYEGNLVNRKYRPYPAKSPMKQDKDALPTLFNIDRLSADPAEIIFCEGEMDCLAFFECGISHAVSLKDGAPTKAQFKEGDKRFEALRTHEKLLTKAKRIVLAGDADAPGVAWREELARRLGRHRCHCVTWPDGCKDASDVLRILGPDAILDALAAAEPYPIEGLQRVTAKTLLALRARPAPATMTTGTYASDAILKLPGGSDGRLIVVTGIPNHGKTAWVRFVMVHTARCEDRIWAVFSPEMMPWEQFAADCAEVLAGKPFWPTKGAGVGESMTEAEIADAGAWLDGRVTMMVCDSEDEAPTVDWLLEMARLAILRDGVTDILCDPWNEVDHNRTDKSTETDYIGRSLQRIKAFIARHGVNFWIIAHPAKPQGFKSGEAKPAPGPYDISGSSHWVNKPDLGITIHSPSSGFAELHIWKARFRRFGTRGTSAVMSYDPRCGRYQTPKQPQNYSDKDDV